MTHAATTTRLAAALGVIFLMTMTQFAQAQTPTNAALQARAKMQQRHNQTGSVGEVAIDRIPPGRTRTPRERMRRL